MNSESSNFHLYLGQLSFLCLKSVGREKDIYKVFIKLGSQIMEQFGCVAFSEQFKKFEARYFVFFRGEKNFPILSIISLMKKKLQFRKQSFIENAILFGFEYNFQSHNPMQYGNVYRKNLPFIYSMCSECKYIIFEKCFKNTYLNTYKNQNAVFKHYLKNNDLHFYCSHSLRSEAKEKLCKFLKFLYSCSASSGRTITYTVYLFKEEKLPKRFNSSLFTSSCRKQK